MSAPRRLPEMLTVLSGTFRSQPDAFAQLAKVAAERGQTFDLADIDVIRQKPEVRLAHYFRPAIVARIQEMQGADDTLLVLRRSALAVERYFSKETRPIRLVGRFAGRILDPVRPGDPM